MHQFKKIYTYTCTPHTHTPKTNGIGGIRQNNFTKWKKGHSYNYKNHQDVWNLREKVYES